MSECSEAGSDTETQGERNGIIAAQRNTFPRESCAGRDVVFVNGECSRYYRDRAYQCCCCDQVLDSFHNVIPLYVLARYGRDQLSTAKRGGGICQLLAAAVNV
jgi:hypothetical protein